MTAFAVFLFVISLMAKTLFDKYGGVPMATRVARDFHERLMRRPHLRRYFLEIPIDRIIQHHIEYISYALGKPTQHYSIEDIRAQHKHCGVTGASFDLTRELFVACLEEESITEIDITHIMETLREVRSTIVTKGVER